MQLYTYVLLTASSDATVVNVANWESQQFSMAKRSAQIWCVRHNYPCLATSVNMINPPKRMLCVYIYIHSEYVYVYVQCMYIIVYIIIYYYTMCTLLHIMILLCLYLWVTYFGVTPTAPTSHHSWPISARRSSRTRRWRHCRDIHS